MTDETFRPQKKSISEDDIQNATNEPQSQPQNASKELEAMAQMRQRAAMEVGSELNNPQLEGQAVKFTGKVPEGLKQAIIQQRVESTSAGPKKRTPVQAKESPEMRVTGSNKLEELIAGIATKGNMVYESIELPSKGKFYNGDDGPTNGVIHLRPMTGEEEEILATPRFVKKGQAINMIFNRCMKENYDSSNFLTQDRTYMLIYLRGISYTPQYDVEVRDPETDQTFATTINLNELYVDQCPLTFSPENLEDTLPVTEYKFRYKLGCGKDEQVVQEYRERRAKNFDLSGQADDTLLFRTAHLIEEIEGLNDKLEIQTLLKKLPIQDVAYLRTVVNEPPFGVDTKVTITNPYTLSDFEIDLPLESNFFFPRAKRKTQTTQ
jgi:hypothetical protein